MFSIFPSYQCINRLGYIKSFLISLDASNHDNTNIIYCQLDTVWLHMFFFFWFKMVQWVNWDRFIGTITAKSIILFLHLKKLFYLLNNSFQFIFPHQNPFLCVIRYIFFKLFFEKIIALKYSLNVFNIIRDWLPHTKWVSSGCENISLYV